MWFGRRCCFAAGSRIDSPKYRERRFFNRHAGNSPNFATNDDQKRVMTPKEAIRQGADYLVIGRPITHSDDKTSSCAKNFRRNRNRINNEFFNEKIQPQTSSLKNKPAFFQNFHADLLSFYFSVRRFFVLKKRFGAKSAKNRQSSADAFSHRRKTDLQGFLRNVSKTRVLPKFTWFRAEN